MTYGAQQFSDDTGVSRETLDDYLFWHEQLVRWNRKINLCAPSTIDDFWHRHALDSWQVTRAIPDTGRTFIDLGSGAGFPGLAVGIYAKYQTRLNTGRLPETCVSLVESVGKKANFLKMIVRERALPVKIISERAESLSPNAVDVLTARAFAPLPRLLTYSAPFWGDNTTGLFHKGENVQSEINAARQNWDFDAKLIPSLSEPTGALLKVTGLSRKTIG